jgi:hypothetical protein
MFVPPTVIAEAPRDLAPHQRLACAVLAQAVADLVSSASSHGRRLQARAWLRGGDCDVWLDVAGLPRDCFHRALVRVTAQVTRRDGLPRSTSAHAS